MPLPIKEIRENDIIIDRSRYDDANTHDPEYGAPPGLSEEIVHNLSKSKNEPEWMLNKRLQALKLYLETALPTWGPPLDKLS